MPTAFQAFAVNTFPSNDKFQTDEQLSLLADSEQNVEVLCTKVAKSPHASAVYTARFDVEHDFLFELQYPGRARGKSFREFVTLYKFPVFLSDHSDGLGFRPLLVKTKKKVAAEFATRLNRHVAAFNVTPTEVDFAALRPRRTFIRGAWFGAMQARNILTTGVFGPHVDQSDEFRHAEMIGRLTNLMVEIESDPVAHTVMITRDGGIVLYNAYQTEDEEVAVAFDVLTSLLAGSIVPR